MIKLFSSGQEISFSITAFPDGTSQVWKLDYDRLDEEGDNYILWLFENEAELFHVCQLTKLLNEAYNIAVDLVCPFLPYGRQDKDITNNSTFALHIFKDILYNAGIGRIETFDAHSKSYMIYPMEASVSEFHRFVSKDSDLICFPDKGAADRYAKTASKPFIWCEKVRDQLTGNITGLKLETGGQDVTGKNIIIIDDICDGGMTFIKVAEALKPFKPKQVDLAISHGLFSKGKQCLHDAGITEIYTTNSLLRNPEGFKIW
jgi:ribose-phosphate pyrophosphokinase